MMKPTDIDAPLMPRDEQSPVFSAPWEAKAFALVVKLHQAGQFTWPEWVAAFSAEIARMKDDWRGRSEDYYECWVEALEKLLVHRGITSSGALAAAMDRTRLNWPHPDHEAKREPVARSLPTSA